METIKLQEEIDESLSETSDAQLFRGEAARIDHFGPNPPDMQSAIEEAERCTANPRACVWALPKKLGRYLLFEPRLILRYDWQGRQASIGGYTDSD